MHTVKAMLDSYPKELSVVDQEKLVACIQACLECGQTCTACADACLAEDMLAALTSCIRLNLDCADICASTAAVLSRQTGRDAGVTRSLVEACAAVCRACGDECAKHASMHEHCRVCAETCHRCEQACADLIATL